MKQVQKILLLLVFTFIFSVSFSQTIKEKAEKGDAEAQKEYALMFYNGENVTQDYKEAFGWFEKAAAQNDVESQNWLAYMYGEGEGVEKDEQKSLEWYQMAAEQGDDIAQYNLALVFYYGKKMDYKKAAHWAKKAKENGNMEADKMWAELKLNKYE